MRCDVVERLDLIRGKNVAKVIGFPREQPPGDRRPPAIFPDSS
jgi:hypothetical protein